MSRYTHLFSATTAADGVYVPFTMIGDPDAATSIEIISALVDAGADALELGIPFSDPVADGPAIQAADIRAFDAGVTFADCLEVIAEVRRRYPEIPIGLLCYGNVVFAAGVDEFYERIAKAGADSVLIPDIPLREAADFTAAAEKAGIAQVFIAPPNASEETLRRVAAESKGYVYVVSRLGVTGTESESQTGHLGTITGTLARYDGPPALLGFGISKPEHVRAALDAGAAGAISGSAIANIIAGHCRGEHPDPRTVDDLDALTSELRAFVSTMKAATLK